jgi:hypothetical protein
MQNKGAVIDDKAKTSAHLTITKISSINATYIKNKTGSPVVTIRSKSLAHNTIEDPV